MATDCATRYRARNSRAMPLYRLFDTHFDEVKGQWEERLAELGAADQADLRGRPAGVSLVRRRDEGDRVHHRARGARRDPEAPEAQGRGERAGAAELRWVLGARCGSVLTAMRGRERCRRRGRSGARELFTEDSGGGGSGAGDVVRQVEGNGRLSIVPRPRSRAGRCGTFEGEKREFLSVLATT